MIGGFLAAGKTTLVLAAARLLERRGLKVAAIFNDQGEQLVDTKFAGQTGIRSEQVTGGCFCCRFSDLTDAVELLQEYSPDVIFAEAVGSCTDLSATTLQPLKLTFGRGIHIAPYTVLVDPQTARDLSSPDADAELAFLFRKQIEEADLICFNKTDLYSKFPDLGTTPIRYLSAATGSGVEAWLTEVAGSQCEAGSKILGIDYETYARAEAKLAWLNCSVFFTPHRALPPATVVGSFMDSLDAALTANQLKIAHLKVIDDCDTGFIKASIPRNGDPPVVEGVLNASQSLEHEIVINARAAGDPATLERIVREELSKLPGAARIKVLQCFSPAPPVPEHRFSSVVSAAG